MFPILPPMENTIYCFEGSRFGCTSVWVVTQVTRHRASCIAVSAVANGSHIINARGERCRNMQE